MVCRPQPAADVYGLKKRKQIQPLDRTTLPSLGNRPVPTWNTGGCGQKGNQRVPPP